MIPNTFSGFGSMTVRNTNIVTMSSFVVMIQCMFHEIVTHFTYICNQSSVWNFP